MNKGAFFPAASCLRLTRLHISVTATELSRRKQNTSAALGTSLRRGKRQAEPVLGLGAGGQKLPAPPAPFPGGAPGRTGAALRQPVLPQAWDLLRASWSRGQDLRVWVRQPLAPAPRPFSQLPRLAEPCRLLFGSSRCCYRPKATAPRSPGAPPGCFWAASLPFGEAQPPPSSSFFIFFFFPCQLEALTPAFLGSCQSPPSAWRPAGGGRARCSALSPRRRGQSTRAPAGKGQGGPLPALFFPQEPGISWLPPASPTRAD